MREGVKGVGGVGVSLISILPWPGKEGWESWCVFVRFEKKKNNKHTLLQYTYITPHHKKERSIAVQVVHREEKNRDKDVRR